MAGAGSGPEPASGSSPDPIEVQITAGALASACEEMGAVLVRSAHSANIKERRDCSAAIFAPDGGMVMQAEHIPVHLGSMPASVRAVAGKPHFPGVSWFLNDPYAGGTHLPDITVVTPAFLDGELIGFAANRAHHADVGGDVPGSMPADSTTLDEEGVIIPPRILDEESILEVVTLMRQPEQRRADLRAQLAANRAGVGRLEAMASDRGIDGLARAMDDVISYAENRTRAEIDGNVGEEGLGASPRSFSNIAVRSSSLGISTLPVGASSGPSRSTLPDFPPSEDSPAFGFPGTGPSPATPGPAPGPTGPGATPGLGPTPLGPAEGPDC